MHFGNPGMDKVFQWNKHHAANDRHSHMDGLEVFRYNHSQYIEPHMDFIHLDSVEDSEKDYDAFHKGGNRHAVIELYLTDLDVKDGGETVFPRTSAFDGKEIPDHPTVRMAILPWYSLTSSVSHTHCALCCV
jgi:hypothetical protein